jgi:type IV pilus assembly protein PilO
MSGLPKGQREQSLILVAVLAIAAIGLYWYMVYTPRATSLEKQQDRIEALVSMNQRAKSEMSKGNLSELRTQLAQYQQNLSLIRTLVPAGNEVPALLEQVSTAARRAGLDLASVDPAPVQEGSNYDTYRYSMAITGGYHELAEFFSNVGSLTRIVLPVNVSLTLPSGSAAKQAKAQAGDAQIEARFQLQTFVTHNAAEDAENQPPTQKGAKS